MSGPTSCAPCDCIAENINQQNYNNFSLNVLCQILAASGSGALGSRIDTEILCDPGDGRPILVAITYSPADSLITDVTGYEISADLPPIVYGGDLTLLIACGSGVGAEAVNITGINGVAPSVGNGATDTGTLRVSLSNDSTGQVKLAAGAAVIGSLTANQSVNVAQIAGTATSVNTGAVDAGTQRVVLATGGGNAPTNVAQWNGFTVSRNTGNADTGTLRVVLNADTGSTLTSPIPGNITQLAGVSIATGTGNVSTGTIRTTPALDVNAPTNLVQINGSTVSTVASGVQKVGTADSAGNAFLSAATGLNSTGTGIQASQIVAQFDDVSPGTITENQFGNARMSANRNLYGTIRDAAGNERGANVNASNQLSVSIDSTNNSFNLAQVAGATVATGHGVASGTIRVELPTDGTGTIASITTSIVPGTAATNLGKPEDGAHVSGDTGVFALKVRNDFDSTGAGTDLDYSFGAVDAAGRTRISTSQQYPQIATHLNYQSNDTAETSSTTTTINATSHAAKIGDTITFTNAVRGGQAYVTTIATNSFTIYPPLPVAPNNADFFYISRPISPGVDTNGSALTVLKDSNGAPLAVAEDAVHSSGQGGILALGVSATTPASANASGDNSFICTNTSGVAYSEPSNQAGTYAAAVVAGASGGITTTGASVLTNSAKAKIITVLNTTDVLIFISLDAGTTYPYPVPANGGTLAIDLGSNGRWTASNISAKSITANSTTGSLYVGLTI